MEKIELLAVEDDPGQRETLRFILPLKYNIHFARTCAEARIQWKEQDYDLVLLDMQLPDGTGIELLKQIHEEKPEQEVIMISAVTEVKEVVAAMKLGATDYLTKPVERERLLYLLGKVEKTLRLSWEKVILLQKVQEAQNLHHGIVGQSLAIRHICETVSKLKGTSSYVLLTGESGVGKEVVAHAIHKQEQDPLRPFIAVNCAAIPENLLESELFGHEKGSFTGASQSRVGKFVKANGGDIFLDEIACMSPTLQAKLLRVLQDKEVEPLGGNKKIRSDFRVIAATNQDIKAMIEKGTFRQDLYFRLQGVEIYIPPLRARPEDVPFLLEYILKKLAPKFGVRHFTEEAVRILMEYSWPGNVREFSNTIENILILNRDEILNEKFLPPHLKQNRSGEGAGVLSHLKSNIKSFERDVIISALKRYRGNKSRASKELGISRSILYRKMKALNLEDNDIN